MNDKFLDAMIEQSVQMMTDACHGKSLSKDEMAFIIATQKAASTGLVSTQLYNNGVAIPGALSSITIDTAGSLKNVSFSTIVRVLNSCACIDNTANLTVVNTGLEATYSDAEITIVRLN